MTTADTTALIRCAEALERIATTVEQVAELLGLDDSAETFE